MKHTAAPWHFRGTSRQGYSQVADDSGDVIATCTGPNHKANASVIAIAPEMYAAIRAVLTLRKYGDGGKRIAVLDTTTARQLRTLLDRAES